MSGENNALLQGLCLVCNIIIIFGIPLGGLLLMHHKKLSPGKPFVFGMLAFFISQICIRLPILQVVLPQVGWYQKLSTNIWSYAFFLGITAGLAEELARFLFLRFALKERRKLKDGISFGLGHGGIEAMLLIGVNNIALYVLLLTGQGTLAGTDGGTILLAGIERLSAIAFHVGATIIVLYGIRVHKSLFYTPLAILLHAVLDSSTLILPQVFGVGTALFEILLAIFSIGVLAGSVYWFYKNTKTGNISPSK